MTENVENLAQEHLSFGFFLQGSSSLRNNIDKNKTKKERMINLKKIFLLTRVKWRKAFHSVSQPGNKEEHDQHICHVITILHVLGWYVRSARFDSICRRIDDWRKLAGRRRKPKWTKYHAEMRWNGKALKKIATYLI